MFKCKTCVDKFNNVSYYCSKKCQVDDWEEHKRFHASLSDPSTSKAAFVVRDGSRYYLRCASRTIAAGEFVTDLNTFPYTEAHVRNQSVCGMTEIQPAFVPYGPIPCGGKATTIEGIQFSDDLEDRKISNLCLRLDGHLSERK